MRFFALVFSLCLVGCDNARHTTTITTITFDSPTPQDYTVGQSSICQVHHIPMQCTSVRVSYGLPGTNALVFARYEASKKEFPNAKTYVSGGCVVSSQSPTNAFVFTCPECKAAAIGWDSTH
jgi:hypothetical protein